MQVNVGVCTFRRDTIYSTLESINNVKTPEGVEISVIVADNDETDRISTDLMEFADNIGLALTYVHAPMRNISIARNACLDQATGDVLVYIDDDETADPDWIVEILQRARETGAGVVFGPAHAVYPDDAPGWMRNNSFHSNIPSANRGVVETGFSSNAYLDLRDERVARTRFKESYGRTGGEDVDFFFRIHRAGVKMELAPKAIVYEPVAAKRMSFGWLFQRKMTTGKIYGHCAMEGEGQSRSRFAVMSVLKSGYCMSRAALSALNRDKAAFWVMRGGFHAGALTGAIAPPQREFYGQE